MEGLPICVIGLGYVGLPLAIRLARAGHDVTGVDINPELLTRLINGERPNRDIPQDLYPIPENMKLARTPPSYCDVYVICVPTPDVYGENRMDATAVIDTCKAVGFALPKGAIVVIESTVTPGSTMTIFREAVASTRGDHEFQMAYSPERVNPGPSFHEYEVMNHVKLIGCDSYESVAVLSKVYRSIYDNVEFVGVEEAELAKTFENAQRDMNIAMMNELAMQCYAKGLNYGQVIRGLRTKASSPVFTSGLVGGHCISVDPYFLAEYYGDPGCLSMRGRALNERFIERVAHVAIDCNERGGPILILGRSYKAGVVDKRNSGALKLYKYLSHMGADVHVHDILVHDTYYGPAPTLVVGAVNHDPAMDIHGNYRCRPDTTLLTIGRAFTSKQCAPFHKIIEL